MMKRLVPCVRRILLPLACAALVSTLAVSQALGSQAEPEAPAEQDLSLFLRAKPDVVILVEKHAIGTDIVEVSMVRADYPPALLRQQIEDFAERLGSELHGLQVYRHELRKDDPKMVFLRASFGVTGLISNGAERLYQLEPLAQSFAGAPEPYTLHTLNVIFQGERPNPITLQKFSGAGVELEGQFHRQPDGIEYRIQLLSQNPDEIEIPDRYQKEVESVSIEKEKPQGPAAWVWVAYATGSLAVGGLVYWILLNRQTGRSPR